MFINININIDNNNIKKKLIKFFLLFYSYFI